MALREGHAVRRAARRRPQGQLRPDRPGAVPGAVHPARAGRGRLADPPPVLRATTASCSPRSRSWSTGPAAGTSWSTTRRSSTSTTQRIPADVVSGRHFDTWWKKARREQPGPAHLHPRPAGQRRTRPGSTRTTTRTTWQADGVTPAADLPVRAGHARPTASPCDIPLPLLNQVPAESFDWQVPGLREELVTALIRSLPKAMRRNFVPVPDYARAALAAITPGEEPLLDALDPAAAPDDRGDRAAATPGSRPSCPTHLRVTFRVLDDDDEAGRRGQGPAGPATPARARRYARWWRPPRRSVARTGLTRLDLRHAAPHHRAGPRRLRGHRVPGAGRRGRHGRGEGVRLRRRGGGGALGRHPPAAAADRAVPGAVPAGAAEQRGEAGAEPQPARRRAGADRGRGRARPSTG